MGWGWLSAFGRAGTAAALAFWVFASPAAALETRVQTKSGAIEGEARADGVTVFRGIPYAAAPIGQLRWRAPQPPVAWQGVRPARAYSADCPQVIRSGRRSEFIGDTERGENEDCLALNIWTTARAAGERRPVMVWIHGGGYNFGSGSTPELDGGAFAQAGVVLVTINYRLGIFGLLAHPELSAEAPYHSSGNYGTLDQIAALGWIKENIAAFGGDPGNVTIFGESAGSGAVNILQASPLARGLFQRAIGESTSQMDWAAGLLGGQTREQAEQLGVEIGASLGARSLAEMRALPTEAIVATGKMLWPLERDGYVLPQTVYETFKAGRQSDVPTLVGWNAGEGINLRVPWINPSTDEERAAFAALYQGAPEWQMNTDVVGWQMRSWAELQARTGRARAYLYHWEQQPPASEVMPAGPIHAAEIVYVFQNFDRMRREWTETDRRIGRTMAEYWINFARTGDPNGRGLPRWPVYNARSPKVMNFAPMTGSARAPREAAYQLIDAYFARRRPPS
ncbi:MAG: carboxylesterase family protein [Hyphomonadaceae bacterium]|nr:carboxylesterase family protein [Hyphomonadaceae bacterium]